MKRKPIRLNLFKGWLRMTQKIKFEFNDKLTHQLKAIDSTVALFKGLPINNKGLYTGKRFLADDFSSNPHVTLGTRVLDNLKKIQLDNDILDECNKLLGVFKE